MQQVLHRKKADGPGASSGPKATWAETKAQRRDMTLDEAKADLLGPMPVEALGFSRAESSY